MNKLTIEQIRKKIADHILDTSRIRKEEFNDDLHFFEQGIFDSMGFAIFMEFLSNEFQIDILENELSEENFSTMKNLMGYLQKKLDIS